MEVSARVVFPQSLLSHQSPRLSPHGFAVILSVQMDQVCSLLFKKQKIVHMLEPLYGYLQTSILSCIFHQIVDFSMKSSLVYQKLFCVVVLLVFEKYFHFGSDTSDYIMMLNSSSMKTSIQFLISLVVS